MDVSAVRRLQARLGVAADGVIGPATWAALWKALGAPEEDAQAPAGASGPLSVATLQQRLGVAPDGIFGPGSKAALLGALTNVHAPALTPEQIEAAAAGLGCDPAVIRGIRRVEAPRGPFDENGRPSILYEKHVFSRNSGHRFDASHPTLSAPNWQPGTYGPFSAQYGKLADACALDPDAAFKACSWGAFQVLGENAEAMGYSSAFDMALELAKSEAAHLEALVRFVRMKGLVDELRACRAGDPASCVPFVAGYNGRGYAANNYHVKLAGEIR